MRRSRRLGRSDPGSVNRWTAGCVPRTYIVDMREGEGRKRGGVGHDSRRGSRSRSVAMQWMSFKAVAPPVQREVCGLFKGAVFGC